MRVYEVARNQNIFDVATYLYGSIEGVFDLMANNDELSFSTVLHVGDKLYWNEKAVIFPSIINEYGNQGIILANGERHVHYKEPVGELRCCIQVKPDMAYLPLALSGDGVMVVDWGDNSELDTITLQNTIQTYTHYFDNMADERTVRLYGDFNIRDWNISGVTGEIYPVKPMIVDKLISSKNNIGLQGLFLFNGTYSIELSKMKITSLDSIKEISLSYLSLTDIDYSDPSLLDDYLIYVAKNNHQRRNCTVVLDQRPSGYYREPIRDLNGNYIITSGMEAIYVILHEPEWNEAGPWVFIINGERYGNDNLRLPFTLPVILD